jgi:serine/threonine protein kinase
MNFFERYRIKNSTPIGSGAFSNVYTCVGLVNGIEYAVKVIDKTDLSKAEHESVIREKQILSEINHQHIVKFVEFFEDEEEDSIYLVLEYLSGGELFDRIITKTKYNEKEARDTARTILQAIQYLHNRDIVHR